MYKVCYKGFSPKFILDKRLILSGEKSHICEKYNKNILRKVTEIIIFKVYAIKKAFIC